MKQFECPECGSNELEVERYVKSWEEVVIHPDGNIEYVNPEYDEGGMEGYYDEMFVCRNCGKPLELDGNYVTTEDELDEYLNLSTEQKTEQDNPSAE